MRVKHPKKYAGGGKKRGHGPLLREKKLKTGPEGKVSIKATSENTNRKTKRPRKKKKSLTWKDAALPGVPGLGEKKGAGVLGKTKGKKKKRGSPRREGPLWYQKKNSLLESWPAEAGKKKGRDNHTRGGGEKNSPNFHYEKEKKTRGGGGGRESAKGQKPPWEPEGGRKKGKKITTSPWGKGRESVHDRQRGEKALSLRGKKAKGGKKKRVCSRSEPQFRGGKKQKTREEIGDRRSVSRKKARPRPRKKSGHRGKKTRNKNAAPQGFRQISRTWGKSPEKKKKGTVLEKGGHPREKKIPGSYTPRSDPRKPDGLMEGVARKREKENPFCVPAGGNLSGSQKKKGPKGPKKGQQGVMPEKKTRARSKLGRPAGRTLKKG